MLERLRAPARRVIARVRQLYVVDVLIRAQGDFSRGDGSVYAAAMTYYVLLSLFPFMIVAVSIFGLLARDESVQQRVVDEIINQLPPGVNLESQIENVVSGVTGARSGLLGAIGLLGALWTASAVFGATRRALNRAFNVPEARPFLHGRARDFASILVVMLLVLASVALTATLRIIHSTASDWFGAQLAGVGWWVARILVPLAVSFSVFMLVYRWIPNHTLRARDLWIGALLAALGFELTKNLFSFYVTNFGRYDEVYGTLGGAMAFLFFVFIMSNVVIFAADINSEIAMDRGRHRHERRFRP